MNTAELIYQDVQVFPESLALEVLDFVEFLKTKNQALLEQERENDLVIPLNEDYATCLNQRILERL